MVYHELRNVKISPVVLEELLSKVVQAVDSKIGPEDGSKVVAAVVAVVISSGCFVAVVCSKVVAAVVVCGDVVVDVVEYVGVVDIFDDGAVGGVVLGALVGLLVLVS